MSKDDHKLFKGLVIILLLFNTFFLASIWYNVSGVAGYSAKGSWCPFSAKFNKKICPLTGKPLGVKGSNYQSQ